MIWRASGDRRRRDDDMTTLRLLCCVVASALAAACAVPDLRPSPAGRANAVCEQRFANPTVASLRGRIPFSPIEAAAIPFAMLSDHRHVTEEEGALRAFAAAVEACRRLWDLVPGGVPDPVAKLRAAVSPALVDLIERKIRFAQYNRIVADASAETIGQVGWSRREDYLGGILRWP
jgi:hypothetical protein